jgi:hypothetical protein
MICLKWVLRGQESAGLREEREWEAINSIWELRGKESAALSKEREPGDDTLVMGN